MITLRVAPASKLAILRGCAPLACLRVGKAGCGVRPPLRSRRPLTPCLAVIRSHHRKFSPAPPFVRLARKRLAEIPPFECGGGNTTARKTHSTAKNQAAEKYSQKRRKPHPTLTCVGSGINDFFYLAHFVRCLPRI